LKRSIRFWNVSYQEDDRPHLLVLDGSTTSLTELPDSEYLTYVHTPLCVHDRLRLATTLIKTPYCLMVSDDEYILPCSLYSMLCHLVNTTYASISGGVLAYIWHRSTPPRTLNLFPIYTTSLYTYPPSFTKADRLFSHLGHNYSPKYINSLMSTTLWVLSMSLSLDCSPPVFGLSELIFEACASYLSSHTVIHDVYWLRSFDVLPTVAFSKESPHNPNNSMSSLSEEDILSISERCSDYLRVSVNDFSSETYHSFKHSLARSLLARKYYEMSGYPHANFLKSFRNYQFYGGKHRFELQGILNSLGLRISNDDLANVHASLLHS